MTEESIDSERLDAYIALGTFLEREGMSLAAIRKMAGVPEVNLGNTLEVLNLSTRTLNALKRDGIHTLQDLTTTSESRIRLLRHLGQSSLDEIRESLARIGLSLRP